jgi:hypothetical protein
MTYELGYIKRMFEEMELNWGTYDYHCNAHLDNLLLLPENSKKLYLAPLDFDLSFFKSEFIDLNYKMAKGIEQRINFDDLLEREKNNLVIQLLGINPIPNIDVQVLDFEKIFEENKSYKISNENFQSLLKENMIEYYSKGYNKLFEKNNFENNLDQFYESGKELVKLILYLEILDI